MTEIKEKPMKRKDSSSAKIANDIYHAMAKKQAKNLSISDSKFGTNITFSFNQKEFEILIKMI